MDILDSLKKAGILHFNVGEECYFIKDDRDGVLYINSSGEFVDLEHGGRDA